MHAGIIYPHQLFWPHPVIEGADQVFLIDGVWLYQGKNEWEIRPHRQRLLLLKAAVMAYIENASKLGVEISLLESIEALPVGVESVQLCRVVDNYVEQEVEKSGYPIQWLETPGFVTPQEWGNAFFSDGKPQGGKWSFDEDNRKKLPKKVTVPVSPSADFTEEEQQWVDQARKELEATGVWEKASGGGDSLRYPTTHEGAHQWLEQFLTERFLGFGTYEDALSTRGDFLYHSVLTPMLNIGLLTPQQVVDETLDFAERHEIPMNDLEGFIRQIIGWREFIAIIYQRDGGWMRNENFWGFEEEIPESVWKGQTGLEPIDYVIDKVNREGYAHHIERLMVMGNFFMLMRIKPNAVYRWFMELFVDAYDWVMVPNVYGMSQYASGGFMVTKPYLSGSNYLKKMSDFSAGEWCRVWDALYWSFIDDHRDFFASQFRMKMMLGHLDRMGPEKLAEHQKLAKEFRQCMREGKRWGGATLF